MTDRRFKAVPWSYNTNIYEVNLRQYTDIGSFESFGKHLPRLRDMGVEILWFMPITPISYEKRLGTLGSYYACSSYVDTNPEYGTIEDFRNLVAKAHELGFKVIIDWVANHTGWDHEWTKSNPGFYKRNPEGSFYDSHGWEDVIDLNYYDHELRREMVKAMRFWVEDCNIDGFRCDMAHLVPLDFWRNTREELDAIRPLFWLAETDDANYFEVFDTGYAWDWMHRTEKSFKGKVPLEEVVNTLMKYRNEYPVGSRHAYFTTNHDENSWNGTEYEKYGESVKGLAVFSYTWNGVPLVYSGQELPNHRRLKFFEKDHIDWNEEPRLHGFYKTLNDFRKSHPVFDSYPSIEPILVYTPHSQKSLCYFARKDDFYVLVILNFSAEHLSFDLSAQQFNGTFKSLLDERSIDFSTTAQIEIEPWDCLVLHK
ncbi:MAG: 1,4-alpha-glucan branching protein [Chitinophagaceae bacterium]|nr:MAG: 1,4-alpha-glucan branching protein [Chitinophagaceae bacterium]